MLKPEYIHKKKVSLTFNINNKIFNLVHFNSAANFTEFPTKLIQQILVKTSLKEIPKPG